MTTPSDALRTMFAPHHTWATLTLLDEVSRSTFSPMSPDPRAAPGQ